MLCNRKDFYISSNKSNEKIIAYSYCGGYYLVYELHVCMKQSTVSMTNTVQQCVIYKIKNQKHSLQGLQNYVYTILVSLPKFSNLYTILCGSYESLNVQNWMCELSMHVFPNLVTNIKIIIMYVHDNNYYTCVVVYCYLSTNQSY